MIQFTEEIKEIKDKKLDISDIRNSFFRRKKLLQREVNNFQKWQEEYKSKFMGEHRFKREIRMYNKLERRFNEEINTINYYLENYF